MGHTKSMVVCESITIERYDIESLLQRGLEVIAEMRELGFTPGCPTPNVRSGAPTLYLSPSGGYYGLRLVFFKEHTYLAVQSERISHK